MSEVNSYVPTVADLIRLHASYDERSAMWGSRAHAAIAAEALRKMLASKSPRLSDSRFVAIEKSGGNYSILFPRISRYWTPSDGPNGILKELNEVLDDFVDVFGEDMGTFAAD